MVKVVAGKLLVEKLVVESFGSAICITPLRTCNIIPSLAAPTGQAVR